MPRNHPFHQMYSLHRSFSSNLQQYRSQQLRQQQFLRHASNLPHFINRSSPYSPISQPLQFVQHQPGVPRSAPTPHSITDQARQHLLTIQALDRFVNARARNNPNLGMPPLPANPNNPLGNQPAAPALPGQNRIQEIAPEQVRGITNSMRLILHGSTDPANPGTTGLRGMIQGFSNSRQAEMALAQGLANDNSPQALFLRNQLQQRQLLQQQVAADRALMNRLQVQSTLYQRRFGAVPPALQNRINYGQQVIQQRTRMLNQNVQFPPGLGNSQHHNQLLEQYNNGLDGIDGHIANANTNINRLAQQLDQLANTLDNNNMEEDADRIRAFRQRLMTTGTLRIRGT